jgi:hypothetical protein
MGVHCIPSIPGGDDRALQYFCREKQISHFLFFGSMYLLFVVWTGATYSTFMPVNNVCLAECCCIRRCNFFIVILYLYTLMWKVQTSSLTHSVCRLQCLFHSSY